MIGLEGESGGGVFFLVLGAFGGVFFWVALFYAVI